MVHILGQQRLQKSVDQAKYGSPLEKMKGKPLSRESSLGRTYVLLSPKTHLFDVVSSRPLSHRTPRGVTPGRSRVQHSEYRDCYMLSKTSSARRRSYDKTRESRDKGAFLTEDMQSSRGHSATNHQACMAVNDLIISHASNLHATERHNTLRLSSDLRSVLCEINRSARGGERETGAVTISMEDKVKAWKEYTEENKRVTVLTKASAKPERQDRLVRRKFLLAFLGPR